MALFNKLFNKRKLVKQSSPHTSTSQFPFSKDQVRILLFRECDWRGRRLLFDSSALEPLTSTQQTQHIALNVNKPSPLKLDKNHVEFCDGKAYKYARPNPDCKNVGEMVFGSVAISFRGSAFKVHWLHSPARILCSQVFLAPVQPYSSTSSSSTNTHSSSSNTHASSNYGSDFISDTSGSISETNSLNSFSVSDSAQNISSRSHPLDVPTAMSLDNDDFKFISQSMGDGSSGYISSEPWQQRYSSARSSLASIYSDIENSSRKMSIDSTSDFGCEFGRFNRRIMKNLSTSFENVSTITENLSNIVENNYYTVTGASNLTGLSDSCVAKLRRNSEVVDRRKATSGDALSSNSSTLQHRSRRPRLAVAFVINMSECMEQEMLCFCSEHMALLESMMFRLRAAAENAHINRQNFLSLMIKAWHNTSQWLTDLFSAPRLVHPMWLSLSTGVKSPTVLVNSFMQDLMSLLNTADTKDTNFFISTLITAVLTHHLGWVGTVAPLMTPSVRDNLNKSGNANPLLHKLLQEENFKLSEISKTYPYNALWAQLGDLYGAITTPIKLSKTIICGSEGNVRIIEKLLNVMTYFIRCSEIRRNCYTKIFDKEEINKTVNNQMNTPRTTQNIAPSSSGVGGLGRIRKSSGLARTATTVKELSQMGNEMNNEMANEFRLPDNLSDAEAETYRLLIKILKKNVMNDIPKVLAFRDSRMVKQELRIGNKSMDTGIEMTAKDKQFLYQKYQKNLIGDHIKFTVTRPDSDGLEEVIELDDEADFKNQLDNFISLSNLITANSLGGAQSVMKMFWGREPYKEALNIEQMKHLERLSAKIDEEENSEKLKTIHETEVGDPGVVFVLGDSDKLVGLKSSPSMQTIKNFEGAEAFNTGAIKKTCKHNRKHSGVKFNFEKYPQIATNYMKSKNLEFHEYDVLEKGMKMEREQKLNGEPSTSGGLAPNSPSTGTLQSLGESSDDECECCQNGSGAHYLLQTPSNATDLEFSGDQTHDCESRSPSPSRLTPIDTNAHFQLLQTLDENCELKSSDEEMKVVEIPMLESAKAPSIQDEIMKPGFTSSLFTAASDHYIADMILQGVTTPPTKWEVQLKQDLTISSHCAVLEQSQAENVAIVANVDKWDVRLVSSHSNVLPSNNTANGIVGMSQLIASMLESVQAMYSCGAAEYQCLSFIESKLREIYLHSETLASFLLETEFCSLSTLTTALNLSVNDIPLLMSVASIHSPMITKKYGITFR